MLRTALFALSLVALSGCGLIYKQNIPQGNVLEQKDVDQLKPGMTKRQVTLIMGTPAIGAPFHDDRWTYLMSNLDGKAGTRDQRRVALIFEDSTLIRIEGDMQPGQKE